MSSTNDCRGWNLLQLGDHFNYATVHIRAWDRGYIVVFATLHVDGTRTGRGLRRLTAFAVDVRNCQWPPSLSLQCSSFVSKVPRTSRTFDNRNLETNRTSNFRPKTGPYPGFWSWSPGIRRTLLRWSGFLMRHVQWLRVFYMIYAKIV